MREVLRSPLFLFGLSLRIVALPFFGSSYLTDLFVPFVDSGVVNPLSNPWASWDPVFFPYGGALYLILLIPKLAGYLLLGDVALGTGPVALAIIKAPLLALDTMLLLTLSRMTRRSRDLLVMFWLNPVLFYISYIHGQLDVASMAFGVLSLHLLAQRRTGLSAVAMGLATLCKFHIVAILPLVAVYLWKRGFVPKTVREIITWFGLWAVVFVIGLLPPMFAGQADYISMGSPEALRVLAAQLELGSGQILHLGIVAVLLVSGRLCVSAWVSERGLVFGSGIILGLLVLIVDPMPGWLFWMFPLAALFFAEHLNAPRVVYWCAVAAYFIHFMGTEPLVSIGLPPIAEGLSMAALHSSVAGILLVMWSLSVRREAPLDKRTTPRMIGIAGDSGAGKSTLVSILADLFRQGDVTHLEGDDYHLFDRLSSVWNNKTHLNPALNDLSTMADHADELKQGRAVYHHWYDHLSGLFRPPRELQPGRVLIVQGLHTFYLREMRDRFDLRIFLSPEEQVLLSWKTGRDVKERGYTADEVGQHLDNRERDAKKYIEPQREYADWIVEFFMAEPMEPDEILNGGNPTLGARHRVRNSIQVFALARALQGATEGSCRVRKAEDDLDRLVIEVDGRISKEIAERLGTSLFPHMRRVTRSAVKPRWRGGHDGIVQLIALALLTEDDQ